MRLAFIVTRKHSSKLARLIRGTPFPSVDSDESKWSTTKKASQEMPGPLPPLPIPTCRGLLPALSSFPAYQTPGRPRYIGALSPGTPAEELPTPLSGRQRMGDPCRLQVGTRIGEIGLGRLNTTLDER
ncbi:hypothetical protein IMZ48_11240 [Candidatus Bathyarchaeota archaeon]|nr:hypothetical protein [Candidatus Bathyarchaeota archaeon]